MPGRRPQFFAFPWGQASGCPVDEYLPRFGPSLGLSGALHCGPAPVTRASDRWNLPRYRVQSRLEERRRTRVAAALLSEATGYVAIAMRRP
jgi:hypothetical protein